MHEIEEDVYKIIAIDCAKADQNAAASVAPG